MSEVFIQEESISGTVNATDVYVGDDVVKSVNGVLPDKNGKLEISIPELDATLTLPDKAADAKAVGDLLTKLRADMPTAVSQLDNDAEYVVQDEIIPFVVICSENKDGNLQIDKDFTDIVTAFESGRQVFLVVWDGIQPIALPLAGLSMSDDTALLGANLFIAEAVIVHFVIFPDGHVETVVSEWAKPDDIPTNVSELENDAGYVTEGEIIELQDAVTKLRDELDTAEPYVVLFVRDQETDEVTCNYTMADINQAKSAGRTIIAHVDVFGDGETVMVPAVIITEDFAFFEAVIKNVIVAARIELDSESGSGESYFCDMLEIPLRQHFRVHATVNSDLTGVTVDCNWAELLEACQAESTVDCELHIRDGDNTQVIILPLTDYSDDAVSFGIVINGISAFVYVWDVKGQANAFLQYIPPKKYQLIKQVEITEEVTCARLVNVCLEKVTAFVSVSATSTTNASPFLSVNSDDNHGGIIHIPNGVSSGTAKELKYVADISSGLLSMSGFSHRPNYTNMEHVVENTDCVEWTSPITQVTINSSSFPAGTVIKIYGIEAD